MKLKLNSTAIYAMWVGLVVTSFSGAVLAQSAYTATRPAISQFAVARSSVEMQTNLVALLQNPSLPTAAVVSTALARGMSPSQVLLATNASSPSKLPQVLTSLALASQSQLDVSTLMQKVGVVASTQLDNSLRVYAAGKPQLLAAATGAAVNARPEKSSELVSVAMAAAARQDDGAALIKSIQTSASQSNPALSLTFTALAYSFTTGKDAEEVLQSGLVGANLPTIPGGALVCSGAASKCQPSAAIQALVSSTRTQQNSLGPLVEAAVAQVLAQAAPIQALVGGAQGTVSPSLTPETAVVGTLVLNPGLVSTGTTP